jgi:hypothetical protein
MLIKYRLPWAPILLLYLWTVTLQNEILIVIYLNMFFEGGTNNQTPADAGDEANLDTQFAFGLSHPIPVRNLRIAFKSLDLIHNLLSQLSFLPLGVPRSCPML